jgi:uncharacterized phage protein (TIGR01671 family)
MRELKFRVWAGKMFLYSYEGKGLAFSASKKDSDIRSFGCYDIQQCLEFGFVVQQFTGLRDTNGKEIYEGDIVKTHHFDDWHDNEGFDLIQIVKWCNYHVGWRGFTAKMLNNPKLAGNGLSGPITIIGNIFESPELLK